MMVSVKKMSQSFNMKRLLLITLISFGWCNVSLSTSLGTDKTVNDY